MEQVMVSVFCLSYNHEKYIREALEGFVKQKTNFSFEVLVHDDASTDGTAKIIREYEKKYPDIIKPIYQTENQYSKGIKIGATHLYPRAKGKYIALCEGDDYWIDPFKLQKQVEILEKNASYSTVVTASQYLDQETKEKTEYFPFSRSKIVGVDECVLGGGGLFSTATMLYRSQYALTPQELAIPGIGDFSKILHLCLKGEIFYLNEITAVYRTNVKNSWVYNFSKASKEKKIRHYMNIEKFLVSFNELSGGKYAEAVELGKRQHQFSMFFSIHNFRKCKMKKYAPMYQKLTWKQKIIVNIGCLFPKTVGALMKHRKK